VEPLQPEDGAVREGLGGPARNALRRHALYAAAAFSGLTLALHLATNWRYGFFRDELCYIAYGKHVAWGYPDCAPLVAIYAWFVAHVLGDSLPALRFLPALAGAAMVFLTGLICVELGGGIAAVTVACLGVTAAPIYLGIDTLFSMNAFEPLYWMGAAYLIIRAVGRNEPKLLLWAGVCLGFGLQNKHSTFFFMLSLLAGIAVSPQRKLLRNRWLWLGALAAFVIFLPNLIWQYQHNWATYELLQNVRRTHKNADVPPLEFLVRQIMMLLPVSLLIWAAGLVWLLRERAYRFLSLSFGIFFFMMMAMQAKDYYLAPAYPMLFAAGGIWWGARRVWMRGALMSLVVLMGVFVAPYAIPVLSVEQFIAYMKWTGFTPPKSERGHVGPLPQNYGDMFGWPETVEKIARAYNSLPPEVRERTGIFCNNYGEAGAVDFFGRKYGLPNATCPHQGYFYFGPGRFSKGDNFIVTQDDVAGAKKWCEDVQVLDHIGHPYAMGEENYDLLLCKGLKIDLARAWPLMKHWN
jgi:hypothetical protein